MKNKIRFLFFKQVMNSGKNNEKSTNDQLSEYLDKRGSIINRTDESGNTFLCPLENKPKKRVQACLHSLYLYFQETAH